MRGEEVPFQQDIIMAVEVPATTSDNHNIDIEAVHTQEDAISSVEVSAPISDKNDVEVEAVSIQEDAVPSIEVFAPTPFTGIDVEAGPIQEDAVPIEASAPTPVTGIDTEGGRSQQELIIETEIPTPSPTPPSVPNTLNAHQQHNVNRNPVRSSGTAVNSWARSKATVVARPPKSASATATTREPDSGAEVGRQRTTIHSDRQECDPGIPRRLLDPVTGQPYKNRRSPQQNADFWQYMVDKSRIDHMNGEAKRDWTCKKARLESRVSGIEGSIQSKRESITNQAFTINLVSWK
jgi:hypothetical protein